jgi:hypothetical protein
MLLHCEGIKSQPELFQTFTSLKPAEFDALLPHFTAAWEAYHATTVRPPEQRQRQAGGGRKVTTLPTAADKLFFILVYCKLYLLQSVLGFLFGMSQGQACDWVHTLTPLLRQAEAALGHLPERDAAQVAEQLADADEQIFAIDGVERRRQRPSDAEKQRTYYSGKKKTHTVKNNVIANVTTRRVEHLSQTHEGKKHDKKICDEEAPTWPAGSTVYQDCGFQGYAPPGVTIQQPKKKPRGGELTPAEKQQNTAISRVRIVVEHVIGGIERCRIVKDVFRNTKDDFDDAVMEIACGLHNLRTAFRT